MGCMVGFLRQDGAPVIRRFDMTEEFQCDCSAKKTHEDGRNVSPIRSPAAVGEGGAELLS